MLVIVVTAYKQNKMYNIIFHFESCVTYTASTYRFLQSIDKRGSFSKIVTAYTIFSKASVFNQTQPILNL